MTKVTKSQINNFAKTEVEVRANRAEQLRATVDGKIAIGNVILLLDKKVPHDPKDSKGSKEKRISFIQSYGVHLAELLLIRDKNDNLQFNRQRMTEYRTVAGTPKAQVEACLAEHTEIEDIKGLSRELKGYNKKGNAVKKSPPKPRNKKPTPTKAQIFEAFLISFRTHYPQIKVEGKMVDVDNVKVADALADFLNTEEGMKLDQVA
jgi:hypothetical protein